MSAPAYDAHETARRLTLWTVVASTAILAASGLLGTVIRMSQADVARLGDNAWYALMTAHGLGAFVGWAAFAVMGFSWWLLDAGPLPASAASTIVDCAGDRPRIVRTGAVPIERLRAVVEEIDV